MVRTTALLLTSALGVALGANTTLVAGKADLKSAGPLAFSPDGTLFLADPMGASIFALDTADRKSQPGKSMDIKGANQQIAAKLGTAADQILINDVAVNPVSHRVYFSVTRGRGADAAPVLLRTDGKGGIEEVALDKIPHSRAELPNAPAADQKDRSGASRRMEAITDIAFVDGKVFVAGLSNEEFASTLRAVRPF